MSDKRQKSVLDIEWFTVSYRTIGIIILILLLIGSFFAYKYLFMSQKSKVRRAMKDVNRKLQRVQSHLDDPALEKKYKKASEKYEDSREAFEKGNYQKCLSRVKEADSILAKISSTIQAKKSGGKVKFARLEGTVKVKRAGDFKWVSAREDMKLREGDKIKAYNDGSAQIMFFNGTLHTISPGSFYEIRKTERNPQTEEEKVEVYVSGGKVDLMSSEKENPDSYDKVITDNIQVKMRDKSEVAVDTAEEEHKVQVTKGKAEVNKEGRSTTLKENESISASKDKLENKVSLPDPPELVSPSPRKPFFFDSPDRAKVNLKWKPVKRAKYYHLVVSKSRLFASDVVNKSTITDPGGVALRGLSPGTYYWKVSVITPDGNESRFSEVRQFRIKTTKKSGGEEPPPLKIKDKPQRFGPFVLIKGKTEVGVYLTINGKRIDVYEDGSFNTLYKIEKAGMNKLKIVAQDSEGLTNTKVVYVPVE